MLPTETRYVVHIGRHKTGTSSLQRALNDQADQLVASGFYYPNAGRDPKRRGHNTMIAHHQLANELRTGQPGPIVAELTSEIKDRPEIVVVSSEALQNLAPDDIVRVFPADQTVIVAYVREQVSYLLSGYAQRVQANDYDAPFDEYADGHLGELNYVPRLEALADTFGPHRIFTRAYDPAYLVGSSTVSDFYSLLGIAIKPPTGDGNPSINANTVLVKRIMNALGLHEPGLYNQLTGLSDVVGGPRHVAISATRQSEIRAHYVEANRDLFTRFIGVPGGTFSLKDLSSEATSFTQDEVVALVKTAVDSLEMQ